MWLKHSYPKEDLAMKPLHMLVRSGLGTIIFCSILAAGTPAATAADAVPHHWSYSGDTGPAHWASEDESFATCGVGKQQSPIDIEKSVQKDLPAIKFAYQPTPLKVTDTGHSFQVNAAAGSGGITVGDEHYDFVQIHFHEPSEERIHGHRYAMVAHIVHKNAKGELAVVAVLINKGKTNSFLRPVFDNFPAGGTQDSLVPAATVNVTDLLPTSQGYFTFAGSLTTPPCSEHVRWFVLKTPVEASEQQLNQFGARYRGNARPTQKLNGRTIEESKD
jgi:carbonic anhydrase